MHHTIHTCTLSCIEKHLYYMIMSVAPINEKYSYKRVAYVIDPVAMVTCV